MTAGRDHRERSPVEREIYQSARRLIDQYGAHAEARAVKRVTQMQEIGHEAATAVWRRILDAIRDLLGGGDLSA